MLLLTQYTLIFASVLLLVALGGCISEHSGVINLGLEGIMVVGALGGALVMRSLGTTSALVMVLVAMLAAALAGMLYSCLLGVAAIHFKADQTLVGTAMNLLATAAATVFVKAMNTAANPDNHSSEIEYIRARKMFIVNINGFEFNWFMLVAIIAVVLVYFLLYKNRLGLRLMACGEHPQAAASVGVNVYKMRWTGVLISGALGGLGGTHADRHRGPDLRPVPRAVQHLHRIPVPGQSEPAGQRLQHDAIHRVPDRSGLHFQSVPRPEGRRHPLRQRITLTIKGGLFTYAHSNPSYQRSRRRLCRYRADARRSPALQADCG